MADLIPYRRRRSSSHIDLTSLVDVVFLLLIFFLVTSQFAQPTASLELPTGGAGKKPDETAIRIELTREGKLRIDGDMIADTDFESALSRSLESATDRRVRFYGDHQIDYGRFVDLLDRARAIGIENFAIVKSQNEADIPDANQ